MKCRKVSRVWLTALVILFLSSFVTIAKNVTHDKNIFAQKGFIHILGPTPAISPSGDESVADCLVIESCDVLKDLDTHNLYRMSIFKQQGHVVFNGRDKVLVAGLLMGADGGIGSFYNLVPDLFLRVYEPARTQQWTQAHGAQRTINELMDIVCVFPWSPPSRKCLRGRRLLTRP
jgi:hypothetical protein